MLQGGTTQHKSAVGLSHQDTQLGFSHEDTNILIRFNGPGLDKLMVFKCQIFGLNCYSGNLFCILMVLKEIQ